MFAEYSGMAAVFLTTYWAVYVLLEMPEPRIKIQTVKLDRQYFQD